MLKLINNEYIFILNLHFRYKLNLVFLSILVFKVSIMRNILGAIGFLIFLVGLSFKIMHWPFASFLFIGGTLFTIVYFLLPKKRKSLNNEILDTIEMPIEDDEIPKSRKIGDVLRNTGIMLIITSMFINTNNHPYSITILWGGVLVSSLGIFILYKP